MENVFDGLISILDMAKERMKEFQDMSTDASKTEIQREKENEKME